MKLSTQVSDYYGKLFYCGGKPCQRAIVGKRSVSRDQLESGLIDILRKCYLKGTFCITPTGSILGKEIGRKCHLERSLRSADKTSFDIKGLKAERKLLGSV